MRTLKELAADTDPELLRALGSLRRVAISLTSKVLWQLVGFRLPDGTRETINAEPFAGVGFSARPSSSGKPEAIVVMVGDAGTPVIIAVRDEKTRAAIAGALVEDESMLYNSKAVVYVKQDGTIEARSATGAAVPLATLDDLTALIGILNGAGTGAGTAIPAAITAYQGTHPTWPDGTKKLKGE